MKEPQIVSLLTPVVTGLDLELEAVDLVPAGKRRLLRIVLDGDGANGRGPNLDDIAEATRAISTALDENDVTGSSPYTLEVSSRGVGRPLQLPRHWRRNVSRLVVLTTRAGAKVTGRIVSADEESVQLDVAGESRRISLADVATAHVEVELNRPAPELDDTDDTDADDDTDDTAAGETDDETDLDDDEDEDVAPPARSGAAAAHDDDETESDETDEEV